MNGRRGYTLVELVVVLVILALAGAVAVPAFAWRPPRNVDAAASRVVSALRLARERAVTRATPVRLSFEAASIRLADARRDTLVALDLPEACHLRGGGALRFAPDGHVLGEVPRVVCGADSSLVRLDPLTGEVMVAR